MMKKSKKAFDVDGWSHVIIEGYCFINLAYRSAHSKYLYTLDGDFEKMDRIPNPDYDPDVKPGKPPKYCERRICNACLGKNGKMCPHFSFGDIDDDFAKAFSKMSRKFYKEVKSNT
jgi:hypothetical protein